MKQIKTRKEIDELCETIVKQYAGASYIEKPVDIAGLTKDFFKLKIYFVTFAERDKERLGCISNGTTLIKLISNDKIGNYCFPKDTILLDSSLRSDKDRPRRRFTLAHELYHYIDSVINGNSSAYGYKSGLKGEVTYNKDDFSETLSIDEWAADRGAAALLMPKGLIHTTVKTMYGEELIPIYGSNMLLGKDKQKIVEMAEYLGVSYTALFIRLKELRLFKFNKADEYFNMAMGGN